MPSIMHHHHSFLKIEVIKKVDHVQFTSKYRGINILSDPQQ